MKKVFFIASIAFLSSCVKENSHKYRIDTIEGHRYETDSYIKGSDGCITFSYENSCGSAEQYRATVCGSYTIEENAIQ